MRSHTWFLFPFLFSIHFSNPSLGTGLQISYQWLGKILWPSDKRAKKTSWDFHPHILVHRSLKENTIRKIRNCWTRIRKGKENLMLGKKTKTSGSDEKCSVFWRLRSLKSQKSLPSPPLPLQPSGSIQNRRLQKPILLESRSRRFHPKDGRVVSGCKGKKICRGQREERPRTQTCPPINISLVWVSVPYKKQIKD